MLQEHSSRKYHLSKLDRKDKEWNDRGHESDRGHVAGPGVRTARVGPTGHAKEHYMHSSKRLHLHTYILLQVVGYEKRIEED
jgi:hypothetical protein